MSQSADTVKALVSEGSLLKSEIKAKGERLKEITDQLVALGAGSYEGEKGEKVVVIQPGAGIKPDAADCEAAREICGNEVFNKLFDREVRYTPKKAFRDLAAALLTPGKATKLIALCEKVSAAFCKWS